MRNLFSGVPHILTGKRCGHHGQNAKGQRTKWQRPKWSEANKKMGEDEVAKGQRDNVAR